MIPEGIWFTAPIEIKSDVELRIEKNAILKFSKDIDQYPLIITNYEGQECIRAKSPITAENAINIGITGGGVIDGSGDLWRPVKQFKLTDRQWEALMKRASIQLILKRAAYGCRQKAHLKVMSIISSLTPRMHLRKQANIMISTDL